MNRRLTFHQWSEWTRINQTFSFYTNLLRSPLTTLQRALLIRGGFGEGLHGYVEHKGRWSLLFPPCALASDKVGPRWMAEAKAELNGAGRRGARSCRELPAPPYLPWWKEWPAAAAEPFSPASIETLWKEPGQGSWIQRGRGSEEWKLGWEGRKRRGRGAGGVIGSREGTEVCISPSLCPRCAPSSWGRRVTEKRSSLV